MELTEHARRIMELRYLLKDPDTGELQETPKQAVWRVAMNVAAPTAIYAFLEEGQPWGELIPEAFPDHDEWLSQNGDLVRTCERLWGWMGRCGRLTRPADGIRGGDLSLVVHRYELRVSGVAREYAKALMALEFFPNSPTWTGAGTPLGQLAACFVLPIADDLVTQRDSIFETLKVAVAIQQTGGGNGFSFSSLRPKGATVSKSRGQASGPVGFLKTYNAAFEEIRQGGTRRGANMGVMRVNHPDIRDFVAAKVVEGEVANFNISVGLTDDFMTAVELDREFLLQFGDKVYDRIRARDLWDELIRSAWELGDPGCLFLDTANRENPCPTRYTLEATNPCLAGDTMIAVADGRGAVPIRDLADAGEDVPVYAYNRESGEVEVATGWNPRITGEEQVYEVTLNNKTSFRVTGNHKFIMWDGSECPASELQPGDSLLPFSRWASSYNATRNRYWFVSSGFRSKWSEHRLIADHLLGVGHGMVVHHDDFDGLNNSWENLIPMTPAQHVAVHDLAGANNPMYGRRHSDETKRLIGDKSKGRTHNRGRRRTGDQRERMSLAAKARWASHRVVKACEHCGLSFEVPLARREQGYCSYSCRSLALNRREDIVARMVATRQATRQDKGVRQIEAYLDLAAELGRDPVKREWEQRCREMAVPFRLTPPSATHQSPFKTFGGLKEAAATHNHRVVSVVPAGVETVYNITVQDHHNYAIVAPVARRGKPIDGVDHTLSGVFTTQCGEQFLPPYSNCCLGSLAVHRFVKETETGLEFDFDRYRGAVVLATEFLDDVVDANRYVDVVPELEWAAMGERRIGLGIMGLADLLMLLDLPYDSDEGRGFARYLMEFTRLWSMHTSARRAKERGSFGWFEDSIYAPGGGWEPKADFLIWQSDALGIDAGMSWPIVQEMIRHNGIRNACQLTIAPTGTISNVTGCEGSGCEPLFALTYVRTVMQEGENIRLSYGSQLFVAALEKVGKSPTEIEAIVSEVEANGGSCQGLASVPESIQRVFKVAGDISPRDHVLMQAALQVPVDNSISKCVVGETLVATEDGLIRMESLYRGEGPDAFRDEVIKVATATGEAKTDAFYFGGEKPVIRAMLRSGHRVTGTPNHPLLVGSQDGLVWRRMDQLRIGDMVAVRYGADLWSSIPAAFDFSPSAAYGSQKPVILPTEMTESLALLLGMYASEGHMSSTWTITVTNSDEGVLALCQRLWMEVFGIEARIARYGRCPGVVVSSKAVCEFFDYLGVGRGSEAKRIPDAVLRSPRPMVMAFLRGLALDAYTTRRGSSQKWAICLDSTGMLDDLQAVLTNMGLVHSRVSKWNERYQKSYDEVYVPGDGAVTLVGEVPFLESGKQERALGLMRGTRWSTSDVVPWLTTRIVRDLIPTRLRAGGQPFAVFGQSKDRSVTTGMARRLLEHGIDIGDDAREVIAAGIHFSPVVEVGGAGVAPVYDISVPEERSFIANGVVSHNTINMPYSATVGDVAEVYRLAYDLGCKGITIYRQGSRVLEVLSTAKAEKDEGKVDPVEEERKPHEWPHVYPRPIPDYAAVYGLEARVYPVSTSFGKLHVTVTHLSSHPGRPFDIRLQLGKAGNDKNADVEAIGRMISLALRASVPVSEVVDQLEYIGGSTVSGYGETKVRSVADAVAKLLKRLYVEDMPIDYEEADVRAKPLSITAEHDTKVTCPHCGQATVVMESGCLHCETRLGGCGLYSACD